MDSGPAGALRSLHTTVFFSPQSWCLISNFSFISKDPFQIPPPLILALPKTTPSNYPPPPGTCRVVCTGGQPARSLYATTPQPPSAPGVLKDRGSGGVTAIVGLSQFFPTPNSEDVILSKANKYLKLWCRVVGVVVLLLLFVFSLCRPVTQHGCPLDPPPPPPPDTPLTHTHTPTPPPPSAAAFSLKFAHVCAAARVGEGLNGPFWRPSGPTYALAPSGPSRPSFGPSELPCGPAHGPQCQAKCSAPPMCSTR